MGEHLASGVDFNRTLLNGWPLRFRVRLPSTSLSFWFSITTFKLIPSPLVAWCGARIFLTATLAITRRSLGNKGKTLIPYDAREGSNRSEGAFIFPTIP